VRGAERSAEPDPTAAHAEAHAEALADPLTDALTDAHADAHAATSATPTAPIAAPIAAPITAPITAHKKSDKSGVGQSSIAAPITAPTAAHGVNARPTRVVDPDTARTPWIHRAHRRPSRGPSTRALRTSTGALTHTKAGCAENRAYGLSDPKVAAPRRPRACEFSTRSRVVGLTSFRHHCTANPFVRWNVLLLQNAAEFRYPSW